MSKTYAIGLFSTSKIIPIARTRRRHVAKRQDDTAKCLSLVEAGISTQRQPRVFANGIALAQLRKQKRKKGGETIMKSLKANLSMLLVVGVLGTSGAALAADGVEVEGQLAPGSYCHEKFPAMNKRSLGDNQPELKQSTTGDIVDYYGPCDENPTGKDQIATQKLEQQHRMEGSTAGESDRFD